MSEPQNTLLAPRELKYYEDMAKKHCPTVFDEISAYNPKDTPLRPFQLNEFQRESVKYQKEKGSRFYDQYFIKEYRKKKWAAEVYNRTNFLRLYELLQQNKDGPALKKALKVKLAQFKRKISEQLKPYPDLQLNFKNYPIDDNADVEQADWEE